jgi:hypothetical protein
MLISIIGILLSYKRNRKVFLPISIYMVANIYVVSSWWCWWYGGSFGLRAYVDYYGVLAIPFAISLNYIKERKFYATCLSYGIILLFIFLNQFNIKQYTNRVIHFDSMSKKAYWTCFLKLQCPSKDKKVLEIPNNQMAQRGIYTNFDHLSYMKIFESSENKDDAIRNFEYEMVKDSTFYKLVKSTAEIRNIPVNEMLRAEAETLYIRLYFFNPAN